MKFTRLYNENYKIIFIFFHSQLIDGDDTLARIELVPTHYEQPLMPVEITRCGIYDRLSMMPSASVIEYVRKYVELDIENVNETASFIKDVS